MGELNDSDLEVTIGCNAVHPDQRGGQHVAKSCVGVRILHRPTGIAVLSMDERSQHANRVAAVAKLSELVELSVRVTKLRAWAEERMAQAKATAESEPWQRFDCHEQSMALVRLNTLHAVLAILSGADGPGPAVQG